MSPGLMAKCKELQHLEQNPWRALKPKLFLLPYEIIELEASKKFKMMFTFKNFEEWPYPQ